MPLGVWWCIFYFSQLFSPRGWFQSAFGMKRSQSKVFFVTLSGSVGQRFWPLSRERYLKLFVQLLNAVKNYYLLNSPLSLSDNAEGLSLEFPVWRAKSSGCEAEPLLSLDKDERGNGRVFQQKRVTGTLFSEGWV